MRKRVLYYNRDLSLVRALKADKKLSLFIFLCTIKKAQGKDDKLTFQEAKTAHLKIAYSRQTIRKYINDLVDVGWANKSYKNGDVYFKSYRKIASDYGLKIRHPKKVYGKTQKELIARASCIYLEKNAKAQVKELYTKKTTKVVEIVRSFDNTGKVGVSVRYLSDLVGYSSPKSGSNCFNEMQKLGMVKRKRRDEVVCHVSQFNPYTAKIYDGRLWIDWKNMVVKQRLKSLTKFLK